MVRLRVAVVSGVVLLALACGDDGPQATGADASETGDGDGDGSTGDGDGEPGTGDGDGEPATGDGDGEPATGDGDGEPATGDGDGEPAPDYRLALLEMYAPRIYFPADEPYFPSSVEFAFPHYERFPDNEGRYWVRTATPLDSPSDTLPFFGGDLDTAPVYAYWADKGNDVVDLVYWIHYPYQRGKDVVDTVWGSHVGDWEHATVRLLGNVDDGFTPSQIYLAAHSFGSTYDWDSGEVELHEGTHPVAYEAWGSHGLWAQPGNHVYETIGEEVLDVCVTLICADLVDETSAGIAWDTWTNVVGFDFFAQEGLGDASWPVWMSDDFTNPGEGEPTVPGQGPIFRWGNPEDCSVLGIPFDISDLIGVCRLEDGPTGPISKSTWGAELL